MTERRLVRFGVSLEASLLKEFDKLLSGKRYKNRSEGIRDLIRDELVAEEWRSSKDEVAGVISLVYDHHKRELVEQLVDIQHDHQGYIVASQHIHLDHDNCLEIIAAKGAADKIKMLADTLRSVKGVKHGALSMSSTGRALR